MDCNCDDQKESWYITMAAKVPLTRNGVDGRGGTLFVGSLSAAENLQFIRECKITHILTVADLDVNIPSGSDDGESKNVVEHLKVPCHDHPMANILKVLPKCLSFIREGLLSEQKHGKGNVLVHCASGVSRSVTVCAAYIMMMKHSLEQCVKASDLIASIATTRKYANPNLGFRRQLAILERQINADVDAANEGDKDGMNISSMQRFISVVTASQLEYDSMQTNVVEDTIRQRCIVNELHLKVDKLEERLAMLRSKRGCADESNTDDRASDVATENDEIEKSLLRLEAELDVALPAKNEAFVDPPARMVWRAAVAKVERLLNSISA